MGGLTQSQKWRLDRYAAAFLKMERDVRNASDRELDALAAAADACTSTNVGRYYYQAARALLPLIKSEQSRRAKRGAA